MVAPNERRDSAKINREIFSTAQSVGGLEHDAAVAAYDRQMIDLRISMLRDLTPGQDILDVGCGPGTYLLPLLPHVRSAVGVDFSQSMLDAVQKKMGGRTPPNLKLLCEDVRALSLPNASVDFVFSFAALYYVPDVSRAIHEIARVLRQGGRGVLEFGNLISLNTLVVAINHRRHGWARGEHITRWEMRRSLRAAGLVIEEERCFQISPMYGTPRLLFFLYPFLHPFWKRPLGIVVGGRMLDEWISSMWPFKLIAFRHIFVVRKAPGA